MNLSFILIMFALYGGGSQTAVRVGFADKMACEAAGRSMQEGFANLPNVRDVKVVWSCNPDRTAGVIEPVPQPPPLYNQPPQPERRARPRPRATPPAEPAPATEESVRKSLPSWLGGEKP